MPVNSALFAPAQLAEKTSRGGRTIVREKSLSDEIVTVDSALLVSAVIAIIRLKAQDLASIPLLLYARRGRSKFRAFDSAYYRLMHDQPNPEMSSVVFRELIVSHIDAWGDFFGQIIADKNGVVQEVWPLRPDRMTVKRVNGEKVFEYQTSDGKMRVFLQDEILHIPGFGFDGLRGMSRIGQAKNAIGLTMAAEKFGSKLFANGANFNLVFKHPGELSDEAAAALNKSIKDNFSGAENSNKFIILEENMSIEKIGIPPDDAQFLETRKFQLDEINRMIGPVPPHLIGDLEKSTSWGTGIDAQEQGYINHSLFPYARRIEQALDTQLLLPADREQGFFYEHLFDGFLRGDIQTRYEAYVKGITNGFISRNEVREKENLNPRKDLDAILQPMNMSTVGGSVSESGNSETVSPAAALEPLWKDAITRVLKREANDVSGALKRWQAKGQEKVYAEWVTAFYRKDHPAFIQKQFKPLLDAQVRLFGVDIGEKMDLFLLDYLEQARAQALGSTEEEFAAAMDRNMEQASDQILVFVRECVSDAFALTNDMEVEYE